MDARKAHKASSSSSPSSSSKRWKYDVFLSFRGEDTRKGFTGHLHSALSDAGIRAFLDDNELKRAEFIKTQLEQAIDGSMISIIVFSKSYADSSWCLDELVKIMECRERLGQQVIPLFYNVEASDVRKQTGSFEQAFEKHEAGKHEKEKVQRWRNALSQAADLCGEDLKNADNGHEAKFIEKILGVVNNLVNRKHQLYIEHLVGITSRMEVLSNHLDIKNSGSKDVVRMIGILGMGGIGKTTLAKAIYNKFVGSFEGRSFLANVREVQRSNGLVGLQEQLLNDILNSEGIKVGSDVKGINMIRERLCCKRALVIIDDADDLQQLKAIAGARDWFGPGSRIIITTRDKHLLKQIGVDGTYHAEGMDEEGALELFSLHAFKRDYPDQEYLDLSKRVIRYCQGLPLALQVVGSFLIERSIVEWKSHLDKLETSPDGNIQKILRISFDGLPDPKEREIFLDISCFFIGMDKDYVTQILDGCGFFATIGISVLIERCLVTVSEYNKLGMHDLLRDMGRDIVYENAHGLPEKFSRLWKREDVTDVLRDKSVSTFQGTEEIEGVALHLPMVLRRDLTYDVDTDLNRFSAQAFTKMKKLRLLHLSGVELTGEYKDFPKKLIWLCWHQFPLESIPDDFPVQPKLVALDLQYSRLKIVWKDCKLHQNLKILNLSYSKLTKSPDFSKLPNLEELILEGCLLSEVHSSIGDLGRLSLVNLKRCHSLRDLPLNFYKSKSVETLLLNDCSNFAKFAEGLGNMVSLTTLKANGSVIRQIPSLSRLSQLQDLSLEKCNYLRAIRDLPTNLKVLRADGCVALEKMPDFSEMSNIRELHLSDSGKLTEIPGLDKSLNSMTRIHMETCTNLTADFRKNILQGWTSCGYGGIFLNGNDIPDWFDYVHDDEIVYFTVPRSVGRILKGLTLSLVYCPGFVYRSHTSISIKNMTERTTLDARIIPVSSCSFERYLWQVQLSNDELKLQDGDKVLIEIIHDNECVKVKKTGVSLVWDKFMNENMIDYHLCAYERRPYLFNDDDIIHVKNDHDMHKSPDFSKFPKLEKLILKGCKYLCKVRSSIGDLGRLSLVNLEGCRVLEDLPLNFYKSKSIETLLLNDCSSFEKLGDGLGDMVSLTILEADNTAIRQIPSSIVKLKKLRILSLSGCRLTEDAIPKDLCSLISLEDLLLRDNDFCSLPSLAGLSKLKVLCVNACRKLRAIPDLPTNLYVLKANGCLKLETISDFSKMSNMRELYLCDSFKLTEIPGLDKSLNSMTRIHMEGCTNLTADFRNNILQRWTSCGFGGIYLNGIYDIPEWFKIVNDVDGIFFFEVPQKIMGRDLKGLTICFVYSYSVFGPKLEDSEGPIGIIVRNLTKQTALHTKIAFPRNGRPEPHSFLSNEPENDYVWQGQLSNDVLRLQGGDQVSILVRPLVDLVRVKKTGVHLEWDKSKSIETLLLNDCSSFEKLGDGLGDMVSLTILEADNTAIRQIPSSIVKLKKLRILSLSGCRLTEDAIPKDLCSLISLEDLLLRDNDFCSLPSLAGLSKLKVLCVNACRKLLAIPDLPTNLYVLQANDCPELETIPDFSKMCNMRELYLSDSFKLTEVPGLDKSLNSMTRIHMEGCTNLTADFRNNILQRWTSCGFGGIYLNGIYGIPEWFKIINDVDNFVFFKVPQRIMGRDLKGLTICFVYTRRPSGDYPEFEESQGRIGIIVRNLTKQTALRTWIAFEETCSKPEEPEDDSSEPEESEDDSSEPEEPEDDSIEPEDDSIEPEEPEDNSSEPEDDYLWQGQLSNDVLCLQGGDRICILVRPDDVDFVRVKKTGVHLEWDKLMKENMDNLDPHLYDLETNPDFSGGVDDSLDPHLYDLETNRDF